MTVTYDEYLKELNAFCVKHNKKAECKVATSAMIENCYHKDYMWSDGHNWTEITTLVMETAHVEVHGVTVSVEVLFYRTEFFSTEDSRSKYLYIKA